MSNRQLYSGNEMLSFNGKDLPEPYGILQFWRVNFSELVLNVNRGIFAEYIVQCALDRGGFPCINNESTGMEPWDLSGPAIQMPDSVEPRPSRIEVKSTASVQLNTKDEDEPVSLADTRLQFSIRKSINFESGSTEPHHNNDLYVFCHYKAKRKSDNILNMELWDFYVFPTYRIREDPSLSKQNTISVWRLNHIGVHAVDFGNLYSEIMKGLKDIESHYSAIE